MLLELQNLGKSFGEHEVLHDVTAGVERGDRIGIIGENGVVGEHAFVGAPPEAVPPEQWGITVLGPGAAVADDYVLPANRMRSVDGKETVR